MEVRNYQKLCNLFQHFHKYIGYLDDETIQFALVLFLWKKKFGVSTRAYTSLMRKLNISAEIETISDYRIKRILKDIVGLHTKTFHMCPTGCLAYTGTLYKDLDSCPFCNLSRWKQEYAADFPVEKRTPKRIFRFFSPASRLQRELENETRRAKLLYGYNFINEPDWLSGQKDIIEDIYDGKLFKSLYSKGFFSGKWEFPFMLSTDGVSVQQKCDMWPIVLINYGLSPQERVKQENMIIVGITPSKPKDMNSFLQPLVEEFLDWNGKHFQHFFPITINIFSDGKFHFNLNETQVIFKGYLIIVGGDMPGIEAVQNMMGHGSYLGCRWCKNPGILMPGGTKVYFPLVKPKDMIPSNVDTSNWNDVTPRECCEDLRRDKESVLQACYQVKEALKESKAAAERVQRSTGLWSFVKN